MTAVHCVMMGEDVLEEGQDRVAKGGDGLSRTYICSLLDVTTGTLNYLFK